MWTLTQSQVWRQGLGVKAEGLRGSSLGFRVRIDGLGVSSLGCGIRVSGLEVSGFGLRGQLLP